MQVFYLLPFYKYAIMNSLFEGLLRKQYLHSRIFRHTLYLAIEEECTGNRFYATTVGGRNIKFS